MQENEGPKTHRQYRDIYIIYINSHINIMGETGAPNHIVIYRDSNIRRCCYGPQFFLNSHINRMGETGAHNHIVNIETFILDDAAWGPGFLAYSDLRPT